MELPTVRPDQLAQEVERHVRRVETHVRARPIMFIAAAALTGFVLGRLLRD